MLLVQRFCLSLKFSVTNKMSYYAVRKGRTVGIFRTWNECQAQVHQFKGAQFKKFNSQDAANDFIGAAPPPPQASWSGVTKKRSAPPTREYHCSINKEYEAPYKRSRFQTKQSKPTVVYTDGCCTSNGRAGAKAGIGVYWGQDHPWNVSEKLPGQPTNQRAELAAAVRALEMAKQNNIDDIEIKTDSHYTIKCATEWIDRWKDNGWKTSKNGNVVNRDLIEELDEARMDLNVKWSYVPGHKGIHGNEEADRLANIGAARRK